MWSAKVSTSSSKKLSRLTLLTPAVDYTEVKVAFVWFIGWLLHFLFFSALGGLDGLLGGWLILYVLYVHGSLNFLAQCSREPKFSTTLAPCLRKVLLKRKRR